MKKALAWAIAMITVVLCVLPKAHAEIVELQHHGDWTSAIDTTSEGANACMGIRENNAMLGIAFAPGGTLCSISLFKDLQKAERESYNILPGMILQGKMRVDKGRIYDVAFMCHVQDNSLVCTLSGDFTDILLRESYHGSLLRIEVGIMLVAGIKDPIICEFSLFGFPYALDRCLSLAQAY